MYHYLFTNDLRITTLKDSLQNAAKCFLDHAVPSGTDKKSVNNNMNTLGFYFNLTDSSNCSKQAAIGNIRAVVLNFIKKFQYPNRRTKEGYENSVADGITIAPMRVIVKILYTMNLLYGKSSAYLTREEIKYFVFYNSAVAKTHAPNLIDLIDTIILYRNNKKFPATVSVDESEHHWNQEDRQIREMVKILKWSGCVTENEKGISIYNDSLSQADKAAIYDIVNYRKFWTGTTLESYREYMDMEAVDEVMKDETAVVSNHHGYNLLFYGVPGSGKSYKVNKICSDELYMERVVFHPDYTYSDFVGQILPRLNENNKLEYVFTQGPFTRIMSKAYKDPSHMYYLIIEEINRGNAPAIFGEIFQLLDRNTDGESEYGITNYDVAREVYCDSEKLVKIPSNLTVIATMNTSDQNVFTLDTAFQRRWKMRHISNKFTDDHAQEYIEGTNITWGAFATVINDIVEDESLDISGTGDKRLGAYFAKPDELNVEPFSEKVLKYLWDDAFRMEKDLVFDEKYKSLERVIEAYERAPIDKLQSVLRASVYNKMLEKSSSEQMATSEE